ncbi:hypothetical protein KI387_009503, partial [Taxus chinensis]
ASSGSCLNQPSSVTTLKGLLQSPHPFKDRGIYGPNMVRRVILSIKYVARIRNALAYATHTFFQNHGFLDVHTPIITTSHSQGAGEAFQVTNIFSEVDRVEREMKALNHPTKANLQAAKDDFKQKIEALQELKKKNRDKDSIDASLEDLNNEIFLSQSWKKLVEDLMGGSEIEERYELRK